MSNIDERVVEMRFDNKEFEKNVQTSIKTLDQLQDALKLEGSTRGLDELQRSANKFSMSGLIDSVNTVTDKFDALGVMGVTALVKITNQAIDAGEKLIKSLSVDNIAAGWDKFAEKTTAVGTLIGQNYSMEEVNEQMARLNWFTDETSYNFTDMVSNISKFTATGQGLEESVSAMEGIALWAAASGQNATKASMAMYQLSQAMGKGVLKYDDWKSIQNASMDTKEFRQQALALAAELGTIKQISEDIYEVNGKTFTMAEMFSSEALSKERWFTDDVMMETFQRYNEASDQIRNYVLEQKELGNYITSSQAIEAIGDQLDELSLKWFKAGMEARTFRDVIDATKDAVSTGWMNTFELVFGNYEEATEMWTNLCEVLYELFAESGNARNNMLAWWKEFGGRTALLQAMSSAFDNICSAVEQVQEAFHEFFTDDVELRGEALLDFTGFLLRVAEGMELTEGSLTAIHDAFEGVFSVVRLAVDAFFGLLNVLSPLLTPLNLLAGYALEAIGAIGRLLTGFTDAIYYSEPVASAIDFIYNTVQNLADGLTIAIYYIGEFIRAFDPLGKIRDIFSAVIRIVLSVGSAIKDTISQFSGFQTIAKVLQYTLLGVVVVIYTAIEKMRQLLDSGPVKFAVTKLRFLLVEAATRIAKVFGTLADKLAPLFIRLATSVSNFFNQIITGIGGIENFGLLDVLAVGIDVVVSAFETAGAVLGNFIDYATAAIIPVAKFKDSAVTAAESIGQWAKASADAAKRASGIETVTTKFKSFFDMVGAYAKKIDVMSIALVGFGLSSAYMMWQIGGVMSSISELASNFSKLPKIMNKAVKAFAINTPTKSFLQVAKAIALLAGSLALLTFIDTGKLAISAGIMILLAGGITAMTYALGQMDNVKGLSSNARSLMVVSAAILVLTMALGTLTKIPFDNLLECLGVLAIFGAGLVAVSNTLKLGEKASLKPALSLLVFGFALDKVAKVFKRLAKDFDPSKLQNAMTGIVTIVLSVIAISYAAGKLDIGKAAGLVAVCLVLSMVASAIKTISSAGVDPVVIFGVIAACVALIALLTVVGNLIQSSGKTGAKAKLAINVIPNILAFAGAIMLVVLALDKLKGMGLGMNDETRSAVIGLIAVIGSLLICMKAMQKIGAISKTAAVAAIAIAVAIGLISKALSVLGNSEHPIMALAAIVVITLCLESLLEASELTKRAKPSVIFAMASIIGILAVVVGLLSNFTDVGKAIAVSIGLGIMFALLGNLFTGISEASKDVDPKTALAFMGIIGFVAAALVALSVVPVEQAAAAAIGVSAVMIVLSFVIGKFAEAAKNANGAMEGAKAILVVSLSLLPAAAALAILANTNLDGLLPAVLALGACMAGLFLMSKYGKAAMGVATTMVVMSASLLIAAASLAILANIDPKALTQAASALAIVMLAFVALGAIGMTPIGEGMIVVALALGIFAAGLIGVATAAYIFATAVSLITNSLLMLSTISTEEAQRLAENIPIMMAALGEGMVEGIIAFVTTGLTKLGEIIGAFVITILDKGPEFASAGVDLIQNFINGMLSLAWNIVTSVVDILVNLANTIKNLRELFRGIGMHIITSLIEGLLSVGGMIVTAFIQVIQAVLTVREWVIQSFLEIGSNIVAGVAEGIISGVKAFIPDSVEELAGNIVDKFCELLGIHSPSDVMAALGVFIPEGAGDGIIEGIPYAEGASELLGSDIIDTVGGYVNYDVGSGQGASYANGVADGLIAKLKERLPNFDPGEILAGAGGVVTGKNDLFSEWQWNREVKKFNKAAVSEQERLEQEMGWNKKKSENPIAKTLEDATKGLTDGLGTGGKGSGGGGGGGGAGKAVKETAKEIDHLTMILDYAGNAVDSFNLKWAANQEGMEDEVDSFNASTDALELLALQLYKTSLASETAEDKAKRLAKSQAEIMEDVKKAYQSVREEFRKTVDDQTDMFSMFDYGKAVKSGDMVDNFKSNLEAIETFRQALDKLSERGIDDGLFRNLAKQGPKGLGNIKAFLQATDEEFEQLNEMWRKEQEYLDNASDAYMGDLAYVNAGGAEAFQHVLDPETGEDTGVLYMQRTLQGMRDSLNVNLQEFQSIGEAVASAVNAGLGNAASSDNSETAYAAEDVVDSMTDAVDDTLNSSDAELIGKNLCEGIAKGITDNASIAINAAIEMAVATLNGAKEALGIASPSKAFEDIGYRSDEGLAVGFIKYGSIVREAATETAQSTLDEFGGVFGRIADMIDGNIELDPTITPVLDLSNITNGGSVINSLLGLNDPYAINAAFAGIQNGGSGLDSISEKFDKLFKELSSDGKEIRDITIHIYPTENQDPNDIADAVSYKINHDVLKKSAAKGGS